MIFKQLLLKEHKKNKLSLLKHFFISNTYFYKN